MEAVRHRQTIERDAHRALRLPVSEYLEEIENPIGISGDASKTLGYRSPYFRILESAHGKVGTGRDISLISLTMKAVIQGISNNGATAQIDYAIFDNSNAYVASSTVWVSLATATDSDSVVALLAAAVAADSVTIGHTVTAANVLIPGGLPAALPMYVSGVAKTGYFAVVGAPVVAGGAGVARFYLDTNGDGTGTAPSEVYAPSLQAIIVNASAAYVVTAVTVDTNRKYIDVTMKAVTFSGVTVVGISVLGSQSLVAAANGTSVNCLVLVKK